MTHPSKTTDQGNNHTRTPILLGVLLLVVFFIAWHLFFPAVGLVAVGSGAFALTIATIVVTCICILMFFIFSGFLFFFIGLIGFVWGAIVIALFPFLLPIIVPVLILMLTVAMIRRRKNK